jgi:hypothetical protein
VRCHYYRYSKDIVYNNFIWPEVTEAQTSEIARLAGDVLDARAQFPDSSLADLYDPLTMPPILAKAHRTLDRAVDRLYRREPFATDADRVAMLFEKYQEYTQCLIVYLYKALLAQFYLKQEKSCRDI